MELSFFSCHHQYNPFLIQNKPFCSIATTRKRLPSKNLRVTQCNCSLSSSYDFSKPTSLTSDHEGRRALLTSLLTIAAAVHACDVAEGASTSRRALKASKIPESEFKALPNGLK
ncbi:hypothetical protein RCOM_1351590 [Ricinus communis]|uniref:Uncharacterized protein n=2 Tax=Ricinus communis TaxID=3988 RepID=B9S094_RICCO|nr:hypothetical protein RCOM_1351590 [Ricinus communis]|eukprot:XP_002519413.1 uncharacterized protein LOC8283929 [Ricinus communis]